MGLQQGAVPAQVVRQHPRDVPEGLTSVLAVRREVSTPATANMLSKTT